jgi:hypothetical protein
MFYKARGLRRKAEAATTQQPVTPPADSESDSGPNRCSQTWAMLIKRVYEIDPLTCPECGAGMQVVAFIEPPQGDVIEKILRHCGLWEASAPRPPPAARGPVCDAAEPRPRTYVDIDTFLATF